MNKHSEWQIKFGWQNMRMLDLGLLAILFLLFSVFVGVTLQVEAKPKKQVNGEHVFREYCSTCHLNGGNKIQPARPVAESAQLSSLPKFKAYLTVPPGHMPHFEYVVKDQSVLKALHDYCKSLKRPIKQAALSAEQY